MELEAASTNHPTSPDHSRIVSTRLEITALKTPLQTIPDLELSLPKDGPKSHHSLISPVTKPLPKRSAITHRSTPQKLFQERLVHQPLTRKSDSSEAVEHFQSTHRSDKLKERSAVRCDVLFADSVVPSSDLRRLEHHLPAECPLHQ
jgi:hypothetical protein